jgi:oligopeptide transport system ATP-binding protein
MSTSPDHRKLLLEVDELQTHFRTDSGLVKAVDGLTFSLREGESVGIVGESGSGKSVSSLSVMRLIPTPPGVHAGQVRWRGENVFDWSNRRVRQFRGGECAMIFQDPMTSLNPFLKIGNQLTESIQLHLRLSRSQARSRAADMLERVGIPGAADRLDDYPHQFSGGMRQRVMIAMALSCDPQLLIADEPTTALDVTIQAQILELIDAQRRAQGTALMLITHDLGVVAGMCDRTIVMYAGRVVEEGPTDQVFADPRMPYTVGLLKSIPRLDAAMDRLEPIPGNPPNPSKLPVGCPFRPRCSFVVDRCATERPPLREIASADGGGVRRIACHVDLPPTAASAPSASRNGEVA